MNQSFKNLFKGVNPHLNSRLQAETGNYPDFHTAHVTTLLQMMKAQLLPIGYTALMKKSLQIRRLAEEHTAFSPRADVLVFDLDARRSPPVQRTAPIGEVLVETKEITLSMPSILMIEDITYYQAIKVYLLNADRQKQGQPVAWVELLSPSNKVGGDFTHYREKRENLLLAGIVFIEIDYLHETPPTFKGVASYPDHESESHPYRITLMDPRPKIDSGIVHSFQFDVNIPIPTLDLRLNADDRIRVDFDAAYQKTFEDTLYGSDVDYAQLPLNFERCSKADQQRILKRMAEIIEPA